MRNRRSLSYWNAASAIGSHAPSPDLQAVAAPDVGPLVFAPERADDQPGVDALIDLAFGPGRYAKTAERLREGNRACPELSRCVWLSTELVAAVRLWPIRIGDTPALFLGPIATTAARRGQGFGRALVANVCEAARDAGDRIVLLVGDGAYFGPLGFQVVARGRLQMPGPVDPARLLWRPLVDAALDTVSGQVRIAPRADE